MFPHDGEPGNRRGACRRGYVDAMSPLKVRPLGGAPGCLVMILLSIVASVVLTVGLNLVL